MDNAGTHTGGAGAQRASDRRLGRVALALAAAAATASFACSVAVGLNLGPLQARAAFGEPLPGDDIASAAYFGLMASNVLWTALGVAGLSLGVAATVKDRGRAEGTAAAVVSAVTPFLSFALWTLLSLATAP
jgi:hypothetical protein